MKKEAMFYTNIEDKVHCSLCPHYCLIKDGHHGKCNVRVNENGTLYNLNYGEITSMSVDPIEKKPLQYYKQGTQILSAGSFGCNFTCDFCQNYTISQYIARSQYTSSETLTDLIIATENNIGIAFTYNEPSIWYEYVYDCSKLLKEKAKDKDVVLVTNGYINQEPLEKLLPYVDAMNIDLKSFSNGFYNKLCGGRLEPVKKTIEIATKHCHVEVTTLLVTGENDSLNEVEEIAKFLAEVDKDLILHLSRYFPRYKKDNAPTDINFMYQAEEIANKYLDKVILGNI